MPSMVINPRSSLATAKVFMITLQEKKNQQGVLVREQQGGKQRTQAGYCCPTAELTFQYYTKPPTYAGIRWDRWLRQENKENEGNNLCACYNKGEGDSGKQFHVSIHGHSNQSRYLD